MNSSHFPLSHSGHDFPELLSRWEKVASGIGIELLEIARVDDYSVPALEKGQPGAGFPIYISAGVHGDECAPVWALLHWAEDHIEFLKSHPFLIFPCLNPEGFIGNTRTDGGGIDLNRGFQDASIPVIGEWRRVVGGKRFLRCLNLHEDYDAKGTYLYEISRVEGVGRQILDDCREIIVCHPEPEIEGQLFEDGLCRHEGDGIREVVEEDLGGGYPEAIYLFLHHTEISLTL